jgi:hypothetical protein
VIEEAQVVRNLKGGFGKFKEREDSDDKEEYLSITMEKKTLMKKMNVHKKKPLMGK